MRKGTKYLGELNKKTHVQVELGLQTSNEITSKIINRKMRNSELEDAISIIAQINGKVVDVISFNLPNGDTRNIIKIKKLDKTPSKYPRDYKEIVKDNK